MSDSPESFFQNFGSRVRPATPVTSGFNPAPASTEADVTPYSTTNPAPRRQQIALELRWKTGKTYALSYAYFVGVGLDGGELTVDFTGFKVTIKGKNLTDLKDKLRFQLVEYIQEVDDFSDKATGDPKAPAVYSIKLDNL
jgi:hypothetical protein